PGGVHCRARGVRGGDVLNARLSIIGAHRGLGETPSDAAFEPPTDPPRRSLTRRIRGRLRRLCNLPGPVTTIRDLGPEDVLVSLGGGWTADLGGQLYQRLRQQTGVRIALVLYDLIPIRFPHFFPPLAGQVFPPWMRAM